MISTVEAKRIQELLRLNQLEMVPSTDFIKSKSAEFVLVRRDNKIVGMGRVRRVQWYQGEICYLVIDPAHRTLSVINELKRGIEERIPDLGVLLLQCTVREDNERMWRILERRGWNKIACLARGDHKVGVWIRRLDGNQEDGHLSVVRTERRRIR